MIMAVEYALRQRGMGAGLTAGCVKTDISILLVTKVRSGSVG